MADSEKPKVDIRRFYVTFRPAHGTQRCIKPGCDGTGCAVWEVTHIKTVFIEPLDNMGNRIGPAQRFETSYKSNGGWPATPEDDERAELDLMRMIGEYFREHVSM